MKIDFEVNVGMHPGVQTGSCVVLSSEQKILFAGSLQALERDLMEAAGNILLLGPSDHASLKAFCERRNAGLTQG